MKGKYLLLGTNLGNRKNNLERAISEISSHIGPIIRQSSVYLTAPWGYPDQPGFYNQVIEIETDLTPTELISTIHDIEKRMGRIRYRKWHERLIDIDIL